MSKPRKKIKIGGVVFKMEPSRGRKKLWLDDSPALLDGLGLTERTEQQWFRLYEWLHAHAEDL